MVESNILNAGTKFIVVNSSDSLYTPGSIGFMSYVRGRDSDFDNVVHVSTVFTKRGKGGKERLNLADISMPIFSLEKSDKTVGIYPDNKRKDFLEIKIFPQYSNIIEMEDIDYLGWALSYSLFVAKLSTKATKMSPWPKDSEDIMNKILYINKAFEGAQLDTKAMYCGPGARDEFVKRIRFIEGSLISVSLNYMLKVSEIEEYVANKIQSLDLISTDEVKAYYSKKKALLDIMKSKKVKIL